jgi:hypothetical protein
MQMVLQCPSPAKLLWRALLLFIAIASPRLSAQTEVRGSVIDAGTKEPLPFCSIILKNTDAATVSDENGAFIISSATASDSIIFSVVGYKKKSLFIKRNTSQRIDVLMESDNINLREVVVRPGRNPAFRIMDLVLLHRNENQMSSRKPPVTYEEYEKFQIYFGNYSDKFTKRKQFRGHQFIFDMADSLNGKALLPIFMSERISVLKRTEDGGALNRNIIAEKSSGDTYEQLTSIADRMVENIDIYKDFFIILDKSFISPVNSNYQLYYKYYLEDSLIVDGQRCYQIRFAPKWKEDLAFSGTMLIHDTTFAVKKIALSINNEINLNYVKDFQISQEFSQADGFWFERKKETRATISPIKRKQSEEFTVRRTVSAKDFNKNISEKVQVAPDERFWRTARHDSLSAKESFGYIVADTLNYVPAVKKIRKAAIAFASGYIETGPVSIGQIHTFYSFNPVELDRFKLGLRTNSRFSRKIQLEAYGAYGRGDEKLKYKGGLLYVPVNGDQRFAVGGHYMYDIQQMGVSANHIQFDNILTSLTRTAPRSRLNYTREALVFAEKSWNRNISNRLSLLTGDISPAGSWSFQQMIDEEVEVRLLIPSIRKTELRLQTRLSFREDRIYTDFFTRTLGSRYPVTELDIRYSPKGFLLADYEYTQLRLKFSGKLRLNPVGALHYKIEGGKMLGELPYLLTELHHGNQTLVYDTEGFNLMKYFEFASDEYISMHLEHHFDGFFLNKVPLVKKASLREVVSFRTVTGTLSDNNRAQMILPEGLDDVVEPYAECSVGLENIFKVVRIDYIWRLTHHSPIDTENWSIKAKLYFSF